MAPTDQVVATGAPFSPPPEGWEHLQALHCARSQGWFLLRVGREAPSRRTLGSSTAPGTWHLAAWKCAASLSTSTANPEASGQDGGFVWHGFHLIWFLFLEALLLLFKMVCAYCNTGSKTSPTAVPSDMPIVLQSPAVDISPAPGRGGRLDGQTASRCTSHFRAWNLVC